MIGWSVATVSAGIIMLIKPTPAVAHAGLVLMCITVGYWMCRVINLLDTRTT